MAEGGEPAPRRKPKKSDDHGALMAAANEMEAKQIELLLADVTDQSPLIKLLSMPASAAADGMDLTDPLTMAETFLAGTDQAPAVPSPAAAVMVDGGMLAEPPIIDKAPSSAESKTESLGSSGGAEGAEGNGNVVVSINGAGKKRAADGSASADADGEGADEDGKNVEMASSEGYHALLQLLRAKTPAELLRASSRLCTHVADSAAPTPGAGIASAIRKECNEILDSNGKEVDLAMLLSSPDRVIQISASKRQKTGHEGSATAWPTPAADASSSDAAAAESSAAAAGGAAALAGLAATVASGGAPAPPVARESSHLKRPAGLALSELSVPAQPSGVPPVPPAGGNEVVDGIAPMVDVATALSPLIASAFGIAPESMRSFLRIDDLTFDLLSPLGTGRPGSQAQKEIETFGGGQPE